MPKECHPTLPSNLHMHDHTCAHICTHTQAHMHIPTKKKRLSCTDSSLAWFCLSPSRTQEGSAGKSERCSDFLSPRFWTCIWVSTCLSQSESQQLRQKPCTAFGSGLMLHNGSLCPSKQTISPVPCSEEELSQLPCSLASLLLPRNLGWGSYRAC